MVVNPVKGLTLDCPDCGAKMVLRTHGAVTGKGRYFWGCTRYPACKSTHGAHADGRPLGIPGDAETREMRRLAHGAFDEYAQKRWSRTPKWRQRAYEWLQKRMGMDHMSCHIARFDVRQCQRVIALVDPMCQTPWARSAGLVYFDETAEGMTKEAWEQLMRRVAERNGDGN